MKGDFHDPFRLTLFNLIYKGVATIYKKEEPTNISSDDDCDSLVDEVLFSGELSEFDNYNANNKKTIQHYV